MPSSARSTRSWAAAASPSSATTSACAARASGQRPVAARLRASRRRPSTSWGRSARTARSRSMSASSSDGRGRRPLARRQRLGGGLVGPGGADGERLVAEARRAEVEVERRGCGEAEAGGQRRDLERQAARGGRRGRLGGLGVGGGEQPARNLGAAGGGLVGAEQAAGAVGVDLAKLVAQELHVVAGAAIGAAGAAPERGERQPEARDRDEPRDHPEEPVDHPRLAIPRRTRIRSAGGGTTPGSRTRATTSKRLMLLTKPSAVNRPAMKVNLSVPCSRIVP